MFKKTVLYTLLVSSLVPATPIIANAPLAIASAAAVIAGAVVEGAQQSRPRRHRNQTGQVLQAAGTVGLLASAFMSVPTEYQLVVEHDICEYHAHIHPAYRYYEPCYYGCRYYEPYRPVYVRSYRYPRWYIGY